VGNKGFKRSAPIGARLLTDSLRLSVAMDFDDERATVQEAVSLGASVFQVFDLLYKIRQASSPASQSLNLTGVQAYRVLSVEQSHTFTHELDIKLDPELTNRAHGYLVTSEVRAYRQRVSREFKELPDHVRNAFADPNDPKKDHEAYYFEMRPIYYAAGYFEPADQFLNDIKPAAFLGYEIGGGLHQNVIEKLGGFESLVNSWKPGLADTIKKAIQAGTTSKGTALASLGGFVPRGIAAKQGAERKGFVLSNHAFGLAFDINSQWNPHIKDRDVIDVLKEITGYDFGGEFMASYKGIPEFERAAQIHTRVQDASTRLQSWLRKYLPIYESNVSNIENVSTKPVSKKSGIPVAPGVADEYPMSSELDAVTAANMLRMEVLQRYHGLQQLREWYQHGIQSIPLLLAVAMVKLGFRWGAMYEHTKDVMHFELEAKEAFHPGTPRKLEDLFPSSEGYKLTSSKSKVKLT
jgi:hypothetical protein